MVSCRYAPCVWMSLSTSLIRRTPPPLRLQCLNTCTDGHLHQNVCNVRLCPRCKTDSLAASVTDSTNSRIMKLLYLTNVIQSCSCQSCSALLLHHSCWRLCGHSFSVSSCLGDEPSITLAFVNPSSGESQLLITFIPLSCFCPIM